MDDRTGEAALCALLSRLTDTDDPQIADRAIALYLDRFGEDRDAKAAALNRLARALIAEPDEAVAERVAAALEMTQGRQG